MVTVCLCGFVLSKCQQVNYVILPTMKQQTRFNNFTRKMSASITFFPHHNIQMLLTV